MTVTYRCGVESLLGIVFKELVAGDTRGCTCACENDAVPYRWLFDTGCQGWFHRLRCGRGGKSVSLNIELDHS